MHSFDVVPLAMTSFGLFSGQKVRHLLDIYFILFFTFSDDKGNAIF